MTTPKQTVITYHTLDYEEARNRIQEFVNKNPGARTSRIIDSLRINPEQVVDILNKLKKEHLVFSKPIA